MEKKKNNNNQLPLKPSIPKNLHNLMISSGQSILIEEALFD